MKNFLLPVILFITYFPARAIEPENLLPDSVAVCAGSILKLSADTTGLSAYSWKWNTGDTTFAIEIAPPVSSYFSVTVTNGIDTYTDSVYVIVNPVPDIRITVTDSVMNQCDIPDIFQKQIYSKVKKTTNIVYGANKDLNQVNQSLLLDLYEPDTSVNYLRPLIIFAHGGGFTQGSKTAGNQTAFADSLARRGFVVACIDYRIGWASPKLKPQFEQSLYRAVQDMNTAIRFFKKNGLIYFIDTTQIFVGGTSIGATTALYSAYLDKSDIPASIDTVEMGGLNNTGGHAGYSCRINGVINCWGGILDSNLLSNNNYPPVYSFQTIPDPTIPYISGLYQGVFTMYGSFFIHRKANEAKVESYLSPYLQYTHGVTPGTSGWDSLLRGVSRFLYNHLSDKNAMKPCFRLQTISDSSSFHWTPEAGLNQADNSEVIATPALTTTYSVTVLRKGCSTQKSISLTVNPKLKVSVFPADTAVCFGRTVTLKVTGGTSYQWQPATGLNTTSDYTVTVNPQATTNYTVTAFDENGCTGITTVSIVVHPLPQPVITNLEPAYCQTSDSVFLEGEPAGGFFSGKGVSGTIFSPSLVDSLSKSFKIIYVFTDSNSCTADTSYPVVVHSNPVVSMSGLKESYCESDGKVELTGTPLGGSFSGEGISGEDFFPATVTIQNEQTRISYSYTDTNRCTSDISVLTIVHTLPQVALSGLSSHYCSTSDSVLLSGNPLGGSFSGQGVTDSLFNPSEVTGNDSLFFVYYSFTDSNSCFNIDSASTIVFSIPVVTAGGLSSAYCQSDFASDLWGNPAGGIFRGQGINTSAFYPGNVSTFNTNLSLSYSYTDEHGCTDSALLRTIVHSSPVLRIHSDTTSVCRGGVIQLSAEGLDVVNWLSPDSMLNMQGSAVAFQPTETTKVYAFEKDENNCPAADSIFLQVHDYPIVTVTPSSVFICADEQIQLIASGAAEYEWQPAAGLNTTGGQLTVATVFDDIVYAVTGKNPFGCMDTAYAAIVVNRTKSLDILNVFPNPSKDNVTVKVKENCMDEDIEISVFNSLGVRAGYMKVRVPEEINFSLKDFPLGLYLIRFKTTKDESVMKVVHN